MRKDMAAVLLAVVVAGLPLAAQAGQTVGIEEQSTERLARRYPFHDSSFAWYQSLGAMGLWKSSELTWNPSYAWLFRLNPRYYLTDKLSVRLKVGLGVELTAADDTTTAREPRWEDLWLDLVYSPVWTIPRAKIDITPSLRLVLPTSKEARAETQYIGIGPGVGFRRSFALPWRMDLELTYSFRYIKFLNQYTTVQYQGQPLAGCLGVPDSGDCGAAQQSGALATSHDLINILMADWGITPKLRLGLMVAFFNKLLYSPPSASIALAGGETLKLGLDPVMNVTSRSSIWYLIEGTYQIHPTVSLGLAVSTLNPQLASDSTYQTPFFNRFTEFVLTTTIALDHVVASVERSVRSSRSPRH